jgi:hypothetical protein
MSLSANCALNRPSASNSCFKGVVVRSRFFGPLLKRFAAVPNGNASIPHLFLAGCPSAILRAIVAIIVIAFKLVIGTWARSHIRKEILKSLPSITNGDSATAIMMEKLYVGVLASSSHGGPSAPFGGVDHSVGNASRSVHIRNQATTGLCLPTFERKTKNYLLISTVTPTQPSGFFPSIFCAA